MPKLAELKAKWFLDVSLGGQFPPQTRHPGTQLQSYTDGNLVEPLIEGETVMADFRQRVNDMIASPNANQHELWIASWRLDPVKLLGEEHPDKKDAEEIIADAAAAGVKVFYLGSGHVERDNKVQKFCKTLKAKGGNGASDKRFPLWGSHHQKFYIFRGPGNNWAAVVGSVDLSYTRWDTSQHLEDDPARPKKGGPTHDVAVKVRGPAVHDIAITFAERWNDTTNRNRTDPMITTSIPTTFLNTPINPVGTHSVQVLRTYPVEKKRGYAWSEQGEFTIWAAYLNAIKKATTYIYIEDQYFYTFHDPPAIEGSMEKVRESDLVYQLGQALKRGVHVIVLVPARSEDFGASYQLHQRGKAAHYLRTIADTHPVPVGKFVICSLRVENKDPVVHSKLMIVDDEFVLLGSANFGQRSMAHDSEIQLGIIDPDLTFARSLRLALWQEHMGLATSVSILDPSLGVVEFRDKALGQSGRLRVFTTNDPGMSPCCHGTMITHIIDPYQGMSRS
jgi:phosphatidylserine/phosphatidylglycerophosphate/cardiolipin synthase-like enzyme